MNRTRNDAIRRGFGRTPFQLQTRESRQWCNGPARNSLIIPRFKENESRIDRGRPKRICMDTIHSHSIASDLHPDRAADRSQSRLHSMQVDAEQAEHTEAATAAASATPTVLVTA